MWTGTSGGVGGVGRGQAVWVPGPPPLSSCPCAQAANSPEGQNYSSELHVSLESPGGPEDVQPAAPRAVSAPSPSALAPGKWPPHIPGPGHALWG